jgi:diguanylate cyclase (GGDEF)-like protein
LLWFEGRIALLEKDETGGGRVLLVATEITERVELYQKVQDLAIRDPLTDCYNRRHFFSLAEKEVQRAIRYGRPLSLILMDIDHFKVINDQNGHQVGDHVLRQVVEQCQLSIRGIDILGRYGGEEFILLLPETNRENALLIAERLRHTIESMEIQAKPHEMISVTISIGVACLQAMEKNHISLESFIEEADKALYKAKEDGRNCTRSLYKNLEFNPISQSEKVSY